MCARVWLVLQLFVVLGLTACSGDDGSRPPVAGGDQVSPVSQPADQGTSSAESAATDACTDFDKRECVITVTASQGLHNCTKGIQICEKGVWTACAVLAL